MVEPAVKVTAVVISIAHTQCMQPMSAKVMGHAQVVSDTTDDRRHAYILTIVP